MDDSICKAVLGNRTSDSRNYFSKKQSNAYAAHKKEKKKIEGQ